MHQGTIPAGSTRERPSSPTRSIRSFLYCADAGGNREATEKDLVDTPWLQRLRRIYQLQSARWVYPSAEHTRFQHSLGTMHNAGEFAGTFIPA